MLLFDEKPKPTAPAENAEANAAAAKKKKIDTSEVQKLKKKADTEKFTKTSFAAFKKEVDAMSVRHRSSRRCYWCLEIKCLNMRKNKETKGQGMKSMPGDYVKARADLDKATGTMCKKAKEINNRSEPGAEVLQVKVTLGNKKRHCKQMCSKPMSRKTAGRETLGCTATCHVPTSV